MSAIQLCVLSDVHYLVYTFKLRQPVFSLFVCINPEGLEPVHVTVQELGSFGILGKFFTLGLLLKNNLFLLVQLIQNLKENE